MDFSSIAIKVSKCLFWDFSEQLFSCCGVSSKWLFLLALLWKRWRLAMMWVLVIWCWSDIIWSCFFHGCLIFVSTFADQPLPHVWQSSPSATLVQIFLVVSWVASIPNFRPTLSVYCFCERFVQIQKSKPCSKHLFVIVCTCLSCDSRQWKLRFCITTLFPD